jgi:hypothetical protein
MSDDEVEVQQQNALEDLVETTIMLQCNKR